MEVCVNSEIYISSRCSTPHLRQRMAGTKVVPVDDATSATPSAAEAGEYSKRLEHVEKMLSLFRQDFLPATVQTFADVNGKPLCTPLPAAVPLAAQTQAGGSGQPKLWDPRIVPQKVRIVASAALLDSMHWTWWRPASAWRCKVLTPADAASSSAFPAQREAPASGARARHACVGIRRRTRPVG